MCNWEIHPNTIAIMEHNADLRAEVERLRSALVSMVGQFAGWDERVGGYSTMCLSALDEAFDALGWDDPHPEPGVRCDEPGCMRQSSCGTPTASGYRRVCGEHFRQLDRAANEGKP